MDYGAAPILLTINNLRKIVLYSRSPLVFRELHIISSFFPCVSPVFLKVILKNIQK